MSALEAFDGLLMLVAETGDIADLTPDEAEQITGRIRKWANEFPAEDVVRAYKGRIWVALAYDSWAEWCECELGGLKLPVPQRREVVAELAESGMSNRAIADVIGAAESTVRNDHKSGAQNYAPDRKVTGQDGKTYPRPQPKPVEAEPEPEIVDAKIVDEPASPRRKPLVDTAGDIGLDLAKITKRLDKLLADDRFDRNRDAIGCRIRPQVEHGLRTLVRLDREVNVPTGVLNEIAKTLQIVAGAAYFVDHAQLEQAGKHTATQIVAAIRDSLDSIHDQVERWGAQ